MIKLQVLVKRRPGISVAEFQDYWLERHGPLVRNHPASEKHIRRYIQSQTDRSEYEAGEPAYDGVAELWFDSKESCEAFYRDEAYLRDIRPDESRFADLESCRFFLCNEHSII